MKRLFPSFLFTAFFIFLVHTSQAFSGPLISDYNEVIKEANLEIDSSMQSGFLHEMAVKHKFKGEYVMNVTLYEKGSVLSVFVITSDAEDVKQQNLVKDVVKQMEFRFKMPKGKTYKFERTFKFN